MVSKFDSSNEVKRCLSSTFALLGVPLARPSFLSLCPFFYIFLH